MFSIYLHFISQQNKMTLKLVYIKYNDYGNHIMVQLIMFSVGNFGNKSLFFIRCIINNTNGFVVRFQQTVASLNFVAISYFMFAFVVFGFGISYMVVVMILRMSLKYFFENYVD